MKFIDILKLSINNLSQRELRSWLTILGIIIGTASIVGILSVGEGMKESISSQLASFGGDMLLITPGHTRATREFDEIRAVMQARFAIPTSILDEKDVRTIKSVEGVKFVTPTISGRAEIKYKNEKITLPIQGIETLYFSEFTKVDLENGRFFHNSEKDVVVIGSNVPSMFKNSLKLNLKIEINGRIFKVIGILEKAGEVGAFVGIDRTIYMPISSARDVLNISSTRYSAIFAKVENLEILDETSNNIETALMKSRKVTENTKDFTITSIKTIQERVLNIVGSMNFFLGGIAAISLLVGAVGIANTMFTSVLERTRLIGTLKALGTKNSEIMKIFLVESALLGFIGGLIGIFCGFIVSGLISEMGIRMGGFVTSVVSINANLFIFAIVFSTSIGIISGILPAKRAANLQPIEALRYE
ncbi:MAG: ABC transporter permease [Candidatus Aenigmatarchaeota archaeon]